MYICMLDMHPTLELYPAACTCMRLIQRMAPMRRPRIKHPIPQKPAACLSIYLPAGGGPLHAADLARGAQARLHSIPWVTVSRKSCARVQVEDYFTRLIQRVAPKHDAQARAEVVVTRRFLENFSGDQVRWMGLT